MPVAAPLPSSSAPGRPSPASPQEALEASWPSPAAQLADELRRALRSRQRTPPPQALTAAAAELHRHSTLDDLLAAVPATLCQAGGFGRAMVSRVRDGAWIPHTTHPRRGAPPTRFAEYCGRAIPFRDHGVESELHRRRTTLLVDGAAKNRLACGAFLRDTRCQTYLAAPVVVGGRLAAVLHVDRLGQSRTVDEDDRRLVDRFARILSDLCSRLHLLGAVAEQARVFERSVLALTERLADEEPVPSCGGRAVPAPPEERGRAAPASAAERVLTPRELEILELVARGATNAEVATRLGISPHTVKSHVKHIHRRLHVDNRSAAAMWFIRNQRPPAPVERAPAA